MDRFVATLRGPEGQLRTIKFQMAVGDQRDPAGVAVTIVERRWGGRGWSPVTVDWLNPVAGGRPAHYPRYPRR